MDSLCAPAPFCCQTKNHVVLRVRSERNLKIPGLPILKNTCLLVCPHCEPTENEWGHTHPHPLSTSPNADRCQQSLPYLHTPVKDPMTWPFQGICTATTLAQELHNLVTTNTLLGPHTDGFPQRQLPGGVCTGGFPSPPLVSALFLLHLCCFTVLQIQFSDIPCLSLLSRLFLVSIAHQSNSCSATQLSSQLPPSIWMML